MANSVRNPSTFAFPIPPDPSLNDPDSIRIAAAFAYEWGWPLVNVDNRANAMETFLRFIGQRHLRLDGWPIGYNSFTLQTEITSPRQRLMCCPNARLLYGGGAFRLGAKGAIFQVPAELDQNHIEWLCSFYDARSLHFGGLSSQYASDPGFYLIVGPNWDGSNPDPARIPPSHVIKNANPTDLVYLTARIFMDPQGGIPPWLHKVNCYPARDYAPGVYQEVVWENVRNLSLPAREDERPYVQPEDFFRRDFPRVLDAVPARPGEAAYYRYFENLLDLFRNHLRVRRWCRETAIRVENTVIHEGMLWRNNGVYVGNGWTFSEHGGQWPIDQFKLRTASAKSNLFQNRRSDTHYYLTDDDSDRNPLYGSNTYRITFEGGLPPAKGPCSITVYSHQHFLCVDPFSTSIGSDPARVITVGPDPDCDIRTLRGELFCLYLRAYWMDESKMPGCRRRL
jgi:hypothetical protein